MRISTDADPYVAYAVRLTETAVHIAVETESIPGSEATPEAEVGVALEKKVVLDRSDATRSVAATSAHSKGQLRTRFVYAVPKQRLGAISLPWSQLRVAIRVAWEDRRLPAARQPLFAQRYFDTGPGGNFAPLTMEGTGDFTSWQVFDVVGYANAVRARKERLVVELQQPQKGRASIVIDDKHGKRIRNLVNAADYEQGVHQVVWDGRDDNGRPVEPGIYTWRALTHAGIRPHYLFSYYNPGTPPYGRATPSSNWGGDHSDPMAATAYGSDVYLGWPVAESGNNIIRVNLDGEKQADFNLPSHAGGGSALMLAADADHLYVAAEGKPWYDAFTQGPDGTWECRRPLNLFRFSRTGEMVRYGGSRGELLITNNILKGSGAAPKWVLPPENLAGFALHRGRLYVSLGKEDRVLAFDPVSGKQVAEIPLTKPSLLAASPGGRLAAISDGQMGWLEPDSGKFTAIGKLKAVVPRGLAISAADEFVVSDNGPDQDIKIFSPKDATLVRTIGMKGGRPSLGAWKANGVFQPFGIALDSAGRLWVAENDSTPRRVSRWDYAAGSISKEFFGPCHYGADGGGFDVADSTRWIGAGVLWKLDFASKSATPLSTLYRRTAPAQLIENLHNGLMHFVHKEGRTFVVSQTKQIAVFELAADQTLRPVAVVGSLLRTANAKRWTLPASLAEVPAVKEAVERACSKLKVDIATIYVPSPRYADRYEFPEPVLKEAELSYLWVDRNGDGLIANDEFQFLPQGHRWFLSYWGNGYLDTTLKIPVTTSEGKALMVELAPGGFLPSGVPDYQLQPALDKAVAMESLPADINAMATDRHQRLLVNANPMTAYGPGGKRLWTIPNNWPGVHASQKAPLPERGVMQGPLFFLGVAPLDKESDVTILNGNHGRFFVVSTDGILMDELFADIRISRDGGPYMIGGEPFGGFFEKSQSTGKYIMQSGHTDYRIFEIAGLETAKRTSGTLTVTPEQAALIASQNNKGPEAAAAGPRELAVVNLPAGKALGADPETWPGKWTVTWGDAKAAYPFCEVKVVRAATGERLHIAWRVKDPSPFINKGKDWMQLFKTGDVVAFEFSTNPAAPAGRAKAAAGDRRLFIAPFATEGGQARPVAVLYDYVSQPKAGEAAPQPVLFSSPWRSEKIDRVVQLTDARVEVIRPQGNTGYTVTADLSLETLGLPKAGTAARLRGDFGVLYGDSEGTITLLRSYWSNKATGLVNDVPGEAAIQPGNWGDLLFVK